MSAEPSPSTRLLSGRPAVNLASIAHFYQQQRQTPVPPDREPAPSGGSTVRIWDGFGKNLGRIRSFDTNGSRMFAVDRLWVEADVVDLCPPRPARIKDYNGRSRRAGYRRDAHRTRTGESLHRCAVSTAILVSWLLSPTHCRASGAERADRIRSRGGSTQPRQYRRTRYSGRNELSRLCLAVLRTAAGTLLSADDIAGAPSTWAPRRLARARLDWMTTPAPARYTGYRFPAEIISYTVWLYFPLPARSAQGRDAGGMTASLPRAEDQRTVGAPARHQ